jgi:hypothetical protein
MEVVMIRKTLKTLLLAALMGVVGTDRLTPEIK